MKCTFIKIIGIRVSLRTYWGEDCPNHWNSGGKYKGGHNAKKFLFDHLEEKEWGREDMPAVGGWRDDYAESEFPTTCEWCGQAAGIAVTERQVFRSWLYNNASGEPGPGDMYFSPWYHHDGKCLVGWENCTDPHGHLIVVLPTGHTWDIDSRAANCTMKEDRTHRCWVRHGEPPHIHVDKDGHTCTAGAGSIAVEGYHGFLHHGELTSC